MPPQDIAAEQGVLGGMMLSKDAIADVVEVLKGPDFYRPAHELVYEAILDLYSRGEPADPVTVSAELTNRGELARVGGAPYLHDLISTVPTAANAGYYARIVRERAVLRRLVEAGTRIVQMGYGGDGGDVEAIVNSAQAELYQVTEKRVKEDYAALGDIIEGAIDEIEASSHRGDAMVGVPTGFADLDQLTNGLHPGQMIVIAARPAVGKALALDTPLPTPTGWTTMGSVRVGDELLGADGRPTRVVAATEVMTDRPCYEVRFSDGSVVVADGQHQWLTQTRASRRSAQAAAAGYGGARTQRTFAEVRTTEDIAATLRCPGAERRLNHSVLNARPLELPPRDDLLLPPYVLGAWLGDGTSASAQITTADPELVVHLESEAGYHHGTVQARLRTLGVLGDKHIPVAYLRASVDQRRQLLAGLLDTDGTVAPSGTVQFAVTSERLARDVQELVHSLGYRTGLSTKRVRGRSEASSTAHTLTFSTDDDVFRLERKRLLHKDRRQRLFQRRNSRFITDVRPVGSVPVRCVQVDNTDHLYLAGRAMIPTHNSTLGLDIARAASIKHGLASAIFSLEMGRNEIAMRLLSAEAKIPLQNMRKGTMREDDWTKLARTMGQVSEAPLFIDDSPNMSLMEIRSKCRRLKQRHDLKLVIVDYLQLMTSGKRVESRQQEVSEFSRALKLLAKEIEVPVIALSQLNRGPEQRTDKKPQMSDLRESGCLPAGTRVLRADTGAEVTMGELFASGARDVPVWALDDSLRYVRRHLTHVFATGTRQVFRLRLASGKEVRATANHPFLAYEGWTALGELSPGDRVAVPRHVPAPELVTGWDDERVLLLAHLLGDGSFVRRQPLRYASVDEANLEAVAAAASSAFGITAVRDDHAAARCTSLRLPAPHRLTHGRRNPIAAWLDELGLFGLRSFEKFVPAEVFSLPKRQIALFLHHLWATDGSVTVRKDGRGGRIYYASTSRRLVDDVSRLLLRFGISARVRRTTPKGAYRPGYTLDVSGIDDQRRFLQEVGVHGARGASAARLLEVVLAGTGNTNVDTVPRQVWDRVRDVLAERGMTHRQFAEAMGTSFCGSALWKHAPSRQRLGRVAELLGDADLEVMAVNDVLWDQVVAIEPDGEEAVYDATVLGGHNFIADGVAVHNSIEQDADMVILLHREDMYEKESPRAGEADFIVAKHRNGPTDTITVAFQGHYSRFVDMAT
ncbi:replicative DNA helicase [Kineococcus xinjiangensis]|uniref:Replicative DNA helicase n=1 Tax=Kineococcus xinjiangensis TaxID=512762 RepID=A0A2S6IVE1_9ACTN|nr:replicative DNA helicase [Kineococcus xinjiangensis]PPK98206.1 replicative DNA helicase [Kineococcus xinjiangensis]